MHLSSLKGWQSARCQNFDFGQNSEVMHVQFLICLVNPYQFSKFSNFDILQIDSPFSCKHAYYLSISSQSSDWTNSTLLCIVCGSTFMVNYVRSNVPLFCLIKWLFSGLGWPSRYILLMPD